MKYDLTEKLRFHEDPVLVVKGQELTVNSDAEAVLRLMDVMGRKGETAGALEALELLMSERDRKKLAGMHLKLDDYVQVVKTAVLLAMGGDPDEKTSPGE